MEAERIMDFLYLKQSSILSLSVIYYLLQIKLERFIETLMRFTVYSASFY